VAREKVQIFMGNIAGPTIQVGFAQTRLTLNQLRFQAFDGTIVTITSRKKRL
jgi:hypothetical protein